MFAIKPKTRKIHFQSKVADVGGGAWKALMYYFAYLGLPSSSDGGVTVALLLAGVTQVWGSHDRTRIRLSLVQIRCRRVWRILTGGWDQEGLQLQPPGALGTLTSRTASEESMNPENGENASVRWVF